MLPNSARDVGRGTRGPARIALIVIALAVAAVLMLRSLGANSTATQAAEGRLEAVELERETAAARAVTLETHAAQARSVTKPALARVQSLRARVRIAGSGQLLVQDTSAVEAALVLVPPLVTERIHADSAAISALSVALTLDSSAAAAQGEWLVAEAKVRDAAQKTVAALERREHPRCGRRCGMVLGAASVVALGIALR